MYINRKTGERVDADWDVKDRKWQIAQTNGILIEVLTDKKFHEQYGEAMICPNKECSQYCECYKATPHICDYACDCSEAMSCPACIPYVPEKQSEPESDLGEYEYCCGIASPEAQAKMEQKEKETNKPKIVCLCGSTRFSLCSKDG
jgi:hypothetical protein